MLKKCLSHSAHYVLALWALGADEEIIQAAYDHDCKYLMPRINAPEKITAANLNEHLGDDDAYLDFFTEIVKKQGVASAVEEYVVSEKANFIVGKKEGENPEMLNRLMDGIIHSMIEVGCGLEFNVPGLVAEVSPRGLAWASVHLKSSSAVIPVSFWTDANQTPVTSLTSRFLGRGNAAPAPKMNVHALTILARILKDSRFDAIPPAEDYAVVYSNITSKYGDAIIEYVRMWTFNQDDPQEAERKIEELVYANTLIYAVAGWSKDEDFNSDFF
ncbi:hypothetical protein C0995_010976, partial [Termitomyces sp. Mi166